MRTFVLGLLIIFFTASPLGAASNQEFLALCYHDIVAKEEPLARGDKMPILFSTLSSHFEWLQQNGYQAIGQTELLAFNNNKEKLAEKAVLISFDDAYESFYTLVYPLLKAYKFKAVLAVCTNWLEYPQNAEVPYGDHDVRLPRTDFLTWEQIKEMSDSGLVEVVSHSHDLHRGHNSSPQHSQQPAGASFYFDPNMGHYESAADFITRIVSDIKHSADVIEKNVGLRPKMVVWPYGRYTNAAVSALVKEGFELFASLGYYQDWPTFPRYMVYDNLSMEEIIKDYKKNLYASRQVDAGRTFAKQQKIMHVDLDTVYDANPEVQTNNIAALLARICQLRPTAVYLQAFVDDDGNGTADALYFPNRHLPLKADLFNYVAWEISTSCRTEVYAWMPMLGFEIAGDPPLVKAAMKDKEGSPYWRLSPFNAENRRIILEIYEDLAQRAIFNGIIFHDDGLLGDYEDASPDALEWLKNNGWPTDFDKIHQSPDLLKNIAKAKTKFLIDLGLEATQKVEVWLPGLKTSRNVYAQVLENPDSEVWFAQDIETFLNNYDYVALMAMPYMENVSVPADQWYKDMAQKALHYKNGAQKIIFELQAVDWRAKLRGFIDSKLLVEQMHLLLDCGIQHLAYYPDDPIEGHPQAEILVNIFNPGDQIANHPQVKNIVDVF